MEKNLQTGSTVWGELNLVRSFYGRVQERGRKDGLHKKQRIAKYTTGAEKIKKRGGEGV